MALRNMVAILALACGFVGGGQIASAREAVAGASLTVDSTVGELLANPAALAVLREQVPLLADNPQIRSAANLPLREIAQYAPTLLTEATLARINTALAKAPGATSSARPTVASAPRDPRDALTLRTVPLWDGPAPGALGTGVQDVPTLTIVTPGETTSFGTAVVVAPGGGYQMLATALEGRQVADWFAAHGVTAFVLRYRLTPSGYVHPTQLLDAKRAIRWVRAHAADYGVDPARIGMIGFSAGGHLTAMAETRFDAGDPVAADPVERVSSRPDFAVLGYAAIDLPSNHWNANVLSGEKPTPATLSEIRPAEHVRSDTPPTFLWATTADQVVPPTNATLMYNALVAAKVPAELHIFANGRHGMGLGMTDPALSVWPTLLQNWLEGLGMIGAKTGTRQ
ncbi:alpha/beta hydrolase [Novosphingobium sp.]|uniref:alpha/beta hydrolase n=1 Tax=Novosphingobium sp. TaxID=1874826 RepID=UPI0038BDD35C